MGAPLGCKRRVDQSSSKLIRTRIFKKPRCDEGSDDEVMLDFVEEELVGLKQKRVGNIGQERGPPPKKSRTDSKMRNVDAKQWMRLSELDMMVEKGMRVMKERILSLQTQLTFEKAACNSLRDQLDLRSVAEIELNDRVAAAEARASQTEQSLKSLLAENVDLRSKLKRMSTELENEAERSICCICYDQGRNSLLLPCQHLIACKDCAQRIQTESNRCPTCREPIELVLECFS